MTGMTTSNIPEMPDILPVFPLSGVLLLPGGELPLNIFEPRYIKMIDDSMKTDRIIGMIQPRNKNKTPELYSIGCAGRITNFNETGDGRYLIIIKGISRFKILKEINNSKPYRECEVSFDEYSKDIIENYNEIKFSDLELIFKNLKSLFKKKGYIINWKDLEKQSLDQTINTLAMASPFSLEEKQILRARQSFVDGNLFDGDQRTLCHNDYQPRNWLWDGKRIGIIDWEHSHPNHPGFDLVRLQVGAWQQQPQLRDSFLDGYGQLPDWLEDERMDAIVALFAIGCVVWGTQHHQKDLVELGQHCLL